MISQNPDTPSIPRFLLGRTCATAGVTKWAEENDTDLANYLRRHHCGDWGELEEDDQVANENALETGARIFSCYLIGSRKIYIITEADRSITTILFASEY